MIRNVLGLIVIVVAVLALAALLVASTVDVFFDLLAL